MRYPGNSRASANAPAACRYSSEEVTRLLRGAGRRGSAHAIPPTLRQSLTARLDRLAQVCEVAQIGAVLGRDFSYRLLCDVSRLRPPD